MSPSPRRVYVIVGVVVILALIAVLMSGCATSWKRASIKGNGISVVGVPDAGKPASLASDTSAAVLPLPAGSKLVITKWEPVAWRPATDTQPEVKPQPAREVTEVTLSQDTAWRKDESRIDANTGTVDVSIRKHEIDVADRAKLLYAALGVGALGLVFFYIKYPTPAIMCGAASILLLALWKLSELPSWMWGVALALVVGSILLWRGHVRGEADGVKAAVSGNLESTPPKVAP